MKTKIIAYKVYVYLALGGWAIRVRELEGYKFSDSSEIRFKHSGSIESFDLEHFFVNTEEIEFPHVKLVVTFHTLNKDRIEELCIEAQKCAFERIQHIIGMLSQLKMPVEKTPIKEYETISADFTL